MFTDKFGQIVLSEHDLLDLYYKNPDIKFKKALTEQEITIDPILGLTNIPNLITYTLSDISVEEFDYRNQNNYLMPEEYKKLDIAKFVLEQCKNDSELQRAGQELLLFQERNMFQLLQYLKYFVDTMRKHDIVWGVGRGSSVSSFVLYLIGVHKINSLYYDLSIDEFIK